MEQFGTELVVLPAVDEDVGGGVEHQQQVRHQGQRLAPTHRILNSRILSILFRRFLAFSKKNMIKQQILKAVQQKPGPVSRTYTFVVSIGFPI